MSDHYKEAITRLEVEAAELTAIINSIPDAVYIGDPTGIKRANQAALDMLGFDSVEELNQNISILADKIRTRDLKTGKRLATEEEPFYKAFFGETTVREVLTTHIKNKQEVIVRCSAAPVIFEDKIIGAIVINSDITEEVKNKKALEDTIKKLAKKNLELDKFVYNTSHDLKSPLNSIGPLLHFIKEENKEKLDKGAIHMLNMAIEKVNGMGEFIQSLLESATTSKREKESVDLNTVARKVIGNMNIPDHIHIFIKHNLPSVKYHKTSIVQVFQNVISNAIKYIEKETGTIKIDCQESGDEYIISINDNGMGIQKDDQEKIFNKFQKVHKSSTIDSSGLGLSIVKEIVEESNGKIWVESEVGKGSTFFFTIPKKSS